MHVLGIVFHMIDTLERVAKENRVEKISAVTLELGEVSGVVPQELTSCWNWAVKKTAVMPQAKLVIKTIPAVTLCENCQRTYPTVPQGRICPNCGSENTWLTQGNEIELKEIEAF